MFEIENWSFEDIKNKLIQVYKLPEKRSMHYYYGDQCIFFYLAGSPPKAFALYTNKRLIFMKASGQVVRYVTNFNPQFEEPENNRGIQGEY